MKFSRHKYTFIPPIGGRGEKHRWELVGPIGGVHFDALSYTMEGVKEWSLGIEYHDSRQRIDEPPHAKDCFLIGGHCWHDGSSSYARDYLWPEIEQFLSAGKHDEVFRLLEHEYMRHFETEDSDE